MIIALAGFIWKVSGSSIAIVAGGPRPGQHADHGAEQHADEAPQQVHRLQRDREALQQPGDDLHLGKLARRAASGNSR